MHLRPAGALLLLALAPSALAAQTLAPKVMVVTMFGGEAQPWRDNLELKTSVAVPGLSAEYPEVACNPDLCLMTTAMGFANAASSVAAVAFSEEFDLARSYFIVAGIAGVSPRMGTLGSAHWARHVVDAGLRHQIDPRESPQGWTSGAIALGAAEPGAPAEWSAGSEIYRLDEGLIQAALAASRQIELADSPEAAAYRARYAAGPATEPPMVSICDTASADTYWHGALIARDVEATLERLTGGEGAYCTTQMEDNATMTALARADAAGRLDLSRVAVLRTASNFDRPAPGQSAIDSLRADSGGFGPATENAFRVGDALASEIIANWSQWEAAPPAPR